jgi:hypothetical protein
MNYLNDFMKDKGDTPIALVSTDKEFPGIIYTRVSNTPLDTDGLMLIQQVESKQNADAVQSSSRPVTIKDIFEPHSNQLNGSTLCKLISDNTSQNLETLSYIVNGNNNPGYVLNVDGKPYYISAELEKQDKEEAVIESLVDLERYPLMTAKIGPDNIPAKIITDAGGQYYSVMHNGEEITEYITENTPVGKYTAALNIYDRIYGTK